MSDVTVYHPPGPVAAAFLTDRSFVSMIMGPQGSGKTGTCCQKLQTAAGEMPIGVDGYRRARAVAVRNTYGDLTKTIQSWHDWVPKEKGNWIGGDNRPGVHKLPYKMDGCRGLLFEMHFLAIGDQRIENVLRGLDFTFGWLNEADLLAQNVLPFMIGRAGRYPPRRSLPPGAIFKPFIIGDFNAPDIENYLYDTCVENPPANLRFFQQPGGRSPGAENLPNLPPNYYDNQVIANASKPWWIRRMVDSQWGYSRDGEPVYPEFQDSVHVAPEPLAILPNIPLAIGLDAGMHPAAVVGQWMPDGQFRIVAELYFGRMGPTAFGRALKVWLDQNSPPAGILGMWADPTAFYGSDGDDLSWVETISNIIDRQIDPAPTNDLTPRLEAVRQQLTYMIDGRKPALLLSPSCRLLRKGCNSTYQFRRVKVAGVEQFADSPVKNDASHPQDSLQYLVLGAIGRSAVINDRRETPGSRLSSGLALTQFDTDFDVFSV